MRINVSLYWITFSSFLSVFYFGFPLQKILAGTFSQTNAGRVCLGQEWFKFEHKLTRFENRRKVIPSKLSKEKRKRENFKKRIVRSARLVTLNPFIQIFAGQVWRKKLFGRYLMQFLLTSFDNRDIFKFSIWTTLAGHHLGYEEYMRKNFLVTITFPLLVNVANVYFFFKVIMPTRYLWFNMPSKSSNNFHFAGVGHIWEAGFW